MTLSLGDHVWIPRVGAHKVEVPCPVCFGKKRVTVILGDDTAVAVPCEYCGIGFEGPRGVVTEYREEPGAELMTITGIQTYIAGDGQSTDYTLDRCHREPEDRCFHSKEEAQQAAEKMAAEQKAERESRAESIKNYACKTFSWNAGYHRGAAKASRKQAEYHDRMAELCDARAKSEPKRAQ